MRLVTYIINKRSQYGIVHVVCDEIQLHDRKNNVPVIYTAHSELEDSQNWEGWSAF